MVALVLVSLTTAACGGGGGSSPTPTVASATAVPTGAATATPTATSIFTTSPTATPGANTQTFAIAAGSAPAVSSGSLQLTTPSTVQVAFASTLPTGTTTLSTKRRPSAISSTGGSVLAYVTVTSDEGATLTQVGGTFSLATAVPAGQSPYLAYWSGTAWVNVGTASGTQLGTTISFPLTNLSVGVNPTAYLAVFYNTTPLATPTPSPSPTASPTVAPSGTATASPTPLASGLFVDTACTQSMATATNTLVNVGASFFSSILPAAHVICISAWDLSSDLDTALVAAAKAGASVTVITPYSQNSSNSSDIATIVAAGGHAKYEYTSSVGTPTASIAYQKSPMDIHSKFAIVDGVAYLDGHNWFTTDTVFRDGYAADFAAIQNNLTTFATPAPSSGSATNFTTDKQVSLKAEGDFIQNVAIPALNTGAANEFNFITESYNSNPAAGNYNDNVAIGMCQIAALASHPLLKTVFEQESGYSTTTKSAINNLMLLNPALAGSIRTNNNGHEKISMIRRNGTPVAAWFGSSNATTTDLFDWGMTTTDPGILSALATYFDNVEYANATAVATPTGTATACGTVHS